MSFIKIKNLEEQLLKIKSFLPEYVNEKYNVDISSGKKIHCLSPLHDDSTPSMSMFRTSDNIPLLKCHSCGITLDIFNVCHITEHRPIVGPGFIDDTVVYLSKKYDIPIEMAKLSEDEIYEMNLINMYKAIHTYIISQDFSSDHMNELKKRGWTAEFAKKIGIGCCYDISHLKDHLKNIGYSYKFMEENDLDHDRLFNPNNLIFTLFDEYGRPVSFSARNLTYDGLKDENGRLINGTKFLNSKVNPRCGVGKKSEILYMFHVARTKPSPSIVFEGNADAVTAHFNGITNAVAICGLSLNESHLNMFRRNGIYDIIVCLDGDEAGQNKAKQILDDALRKVHDIKIRFIFLPDKKIVDASGNTVLVKSDPDEYIREFGAESFLKLPKIDPFSWRLQQFDYDEARDSESICFAMIPIISADPSSIKREGMIRELSQYTGVSEKAIREEVNKIVNADDLKIAKAKKAILDELVNQLSAGEVAGIETFLNSAIDKIQDVEKQFKTSVLDTEARVADMLGIKAYQESEEGHTQFNFGNDYRSINIALNGDLKQKMMLVGGTANAGKTSMLAGLSWNIATLNESAMCIYLTIDDSAKEFLPRVISYDVSKRIHGQYHDLFDMININKFATPYLYKDSIEYDSLMAERSTTYKQLLSMAEQDKFIILDSEHGKSIEFVGSILKHYTSKYPDRHIFLFIDNIHLLSVPNYDESRQKYKFLSHELKSMTVKYGVTLIGTIEYRKLPPGMKPTNSDIAEAASFEYDANAILHIYNDLHSRRDDSDYYHWNYDGTYKMPCLEAYFGKNKISSFKGTFWIQTWPDKAFGKEVTEQAMRDMCDANRQDREQAKRDAYEALNEQNTY